MKFDIIGDIHGCYQTATALVEKLGYKKGVHPDKRTLIFVGDLVDRGPQSLKTLQFVKDLVNQGHFCVQGNHDNKFMRYLKGNNVKVSHGLATTVKEVEADPEFNKEETIEFIESMPLFLDFPTEGLVVAHASWHEGLRTNSKKSYIKGQCLYGPTTGELDENGLPNRIDWPSKREVTETSPLIVYGHSIFREPRMINETAGIDTGCGEGGRLSALRFPEREIVQVDNLDLEEKEIDSSRMITDD